MDNKKEIREFLTSRRARLTPEQVGLNSYGPRRVPGLRREEVAVLAGVSVPYYIRLERGDMNGVSGNVLDALARALQLDEAEHAHLFDLARSAAPAAVRPRRRQTKTSVRPEVQWTLDAITGAAAYVGNARLDILAANELGRALFSEHVRRTGPTRQQRPLRLPRPARRAFYSDWAPRRQRHRGHPALGRRPRPARPRPHQSSSANSQPTATSSAPAGPPTTCASTTPPSSTSTTPSVGELSLSFNRLELAADHGLALFTYAAEPGSRSEEALKLLGSWAATIDPAESAHSTDQSQR